MVCGSSLRDILSFGFFYTWLHSSHPFPTSVFMKTFPINLCRRELSTFPLSPAKDAVFLCDELVRDYPAEIFSVEVNLYHFSRSGLAMDIGWAGSASRAVQDPCNPQMLILDGKASPECPEERTSKEWLSWFTLRASALFLGWLVQLPPSPLHQNPLGTDHQHGILARIEALEGGAVPRQIFGSLIAVTWGWTAPVVVEQKPPTLPVLGRDLARRGAATHGCELWAGQLQLTLSSYTQLWVRDRLALKPSQAMPVWAEPFLVYRHHQKVFKELRSFYHEAEVAWNPLCGWLGFG